MKVVPDIQDAYFSRAASHLTEIKNFGTFEMRANGAETSLESFLKIRKLLNFRSIKPEIPRGDQMEQKFAVRNFPKLGYTCRHCPISLKF